MLLLFFTRELGIGPAVIGIIISSTGIASLIGAFCASAIEQRLGPGFVRTHRSAIASIADITRLEPAEGTSWCASVRGVATPIPVSRRHLSAVRAAIE